ncbi:GTPase Era [Candidatus Methylomirabilis lanthanidiphila]|uniref:GTPase Era n=1 Tax=Candidatus Methylomirabilis lanthanidiphila TaxID=2211376 RepID=A0A564ZM75_9BACT|nr:GTPase Era [Candidatus Methylomirabilis lanthanidiphila]VUZ85752.1 GTPase Era [Candidatus Methylomirabilis lanthanidiphila]
MNVHKSGFIVIVGRPNVGKSTLMNRLLGHKVSIVSPRPQTTRTQIRGIKNLPGAQLIFLDTPGIDKSGGYFHRLLVKTATNSLEGADLILWMVEAPDPLSQDDKLILEILKRVTSPILLAINKVDLAEKESLLPTIDRFRTLLTFAEIVPISATAGDNVALLESLLVQYLPEGPPLYPLDQVTDQPEQFIIAELIRERVFRSVYQEVPYAVAVLVEKVRAREGRALTDVEATIYVEKDSQKAIIIGRGGGMLKRIGELVRPEIEKLLGTQVFLKLWVKVRSDWQKDDEALKRLGYLQQ